MFAFCWLLSTQGLFIPVPTYLAHLTPEPMMLSLQKQGLKVKSHGRPASFSAVLATCRLVLTLSSASSTSAESWTVQDFNPGTRMEPKGVGDASFIAWDLLIMSNKNDFPTSQSQIIFDLNMKIQAREQNRNRPWKQPLAIWDQQGQCEVSIHKVY